MKTRLFLVSVSILFDRLFTVLRKLLKNKLYGQHIARKLVIYALRSHVKEKQPKKALTMSFHGQPGTGKNYLSKFIVEAFYKKSENSKYVHNFKGRLHFRSGGLVKEYQVCIRLRCYH